MMGQGGDPDRRTIPNPCVNVDNNHGFEMWTRRHKTKRRSISGMGNQLMDGIHAKKRHDGRRCAEKRHEWNTKKLKEHIEKRYERQEKNKISRRDGHNG